MTRNRASLNRVKDNELLHRLEVSCDSYLRDHRNAGETGRLLSEIYRRVAQEGIEDHASLRPIIETMCKLSPLAKEDQTQLCSALSEAFITAHSQPWREARDLYDSLPENCRHTLRDKKDDLALLDDITQTLCYIKESPAEEQDPLLQDLKDQLDIVLERLEEGGLQHHSSFEPLVRLMAPLSKLDVSENMSKVARTLSPLAHDEPEPQLWGDLLQPQSPAMPSAHPAAA